jgi:hypothetical protein
MDIPTFWNLIQTAREKSGGDNDRQTTLLIEALSQKPEDEILAFDRIFGEMLHKAYRADLWEAAIFIHCGCTEDCFSDFRGCLIAHGKEVFEKALENPDNLADVVDVQYREDLRMRYQFFASVAWHAYELKTRQEMPLIPGQDGASQMSGETHDEDELPAIFPRLAAKLGNCSDWWESYLSRPHTEE